MKLFWAILLVVFVAAGVLLLRQGGHANNAAPPSALPAESAPDASHAPAASAAAGAPQAKAEVPALKAPEPSPAAAKPTTEAATSAPAAGTPAKPVASIDDLNSLLNLPPAPAAAKAEPKADAAPEKPVAKTPPPPPPPAAPAPAASALNATPPPTAASTTGAKPAAATGATTGAATGVAGKFSEIVPVRKAPGEDGWTTLDERFQIKGSGTAEDPYEVSWDLLVSASETYQPRMGKLRMPERITMLDGKFVRITGYVAFPIMAIEQNEMLSMRNMWDGCCIGTPPTPYDAIEVKLKKAATGKDRFASYGSVYGKFSVDPYVKGNWLLGLYLMNDAELGPGKQGGL